LPDDAEPSPDELAPAAEEPEPDGAAAAFPSPVYEPDLDAEPSEDFASDEAPSLPDELDAPDDADE